MNIDQAQADMRYAYVGGSTGILASACVWLAAAITSIVANPRAAMITLFFGGMLIHPLAMLLSRRMGRPGAHAKGNPLGRLALESTVWLLLAIPLAFAVSLHRTEWFFVAMLLTIAGRYLTFSTVYGLRIYWACGAALAAAAFALAALGAQSTVAAFTGALIEFAFAAVVFNFARRA